MNNINLSAYLNKQDGDTLPAATWNGVFTTLQSKINEIINKLNSDDSGTDPGDDEPSVVETELVINGQTVSMTDGVVTIAAGQDYTISGTLNGQLVIDAESAKPAANTNIKLNGVTITTDKESAILYKTPENNTGYKDLVITLEKDSTNYVICTSEAELASDQAAAIYSMNNMTIQGVGYLVCHNMAGHGVRATELKIAGPHLYTNTSHDGVHAGKLLHIYDVTYCVNQGKDAFGTGSDGKIFIFGGEYYCIPKVAGITDPQYTLKLTGAYFHAPIVYGTPNVNLGYTNVTDFPIKGLVTPSFAGGDSVVTLTGTAQIVNQTAQQVVSVGATPISKYYESIPKTFVGYDTKDDMKNGNNPHSGGARSDFEYPYIVITGYHSNDNESGFFETASKNFGTEDAPDYSVNVYLENAYVDGLYYGFNKDKDESDTIGKIKVVSKADSINVVCPYDDPYTKGPQSYNEGNINDAIKSENNIDIEVKNDSVLFVCSKWGDGIDGGTTKITDSKGTLIVTDCASRGIKGNCIVVGPNAEVSKSSVTSYYTDSTDADNYSEFEGIVIAKNNCKTDNASFGVSTTEDKDVKTTGFADIYGRNGKHKKGEFGTRSAQLKGVVICGTISAALKIDMDNSDNIYYNELLEGESAPTKVNIPTATSEAYIVKTEDKSFKYNTTVPSIEGGGTVLNPITQG